MENKRNKARLLEGMNIRKKKKRIQEAAHRASEGEDTESKV